MLRSTWCLAILAAGLVMVSGLGLSVSEASRRKSTRKAPPPPAATARPVEEIVDGYGPNAKAARARALENALERIAEILRQEVGDPNWQVPADLLDPEKLEKEYAVLSEVDKPKPAPEANDDRALVARYKIQLTTDYIDAAQKQAMQERVLARHGLLARLLGGLLAVLLVTAGYLRLEEMTRGYATQLLRLGAFIVLALTGLAIWLTI
jgi:hypothetical protein